MKITALGLAVLTILAVTALLPIAIAQEVPAHVVISEVLPNPTGTEDGKEYVELYNPTNIEIDIGGWVIDTKSDTDADATIPHGAKIQVHGFYLVGDTPWTPEAGWPTSPDHEEEIALANNEGWVRLRKNLGGNIVDTVGWGTATTNETLNAAKPADGESIERKSLNGGYAPCQDTDDNSFDFSVQGTPTPKNSASPEMDPAPVELFDAAGNFKGGFNKIQDAVNNAADGDTVLVHDGTYNENVDVTKSHLTIRSEHGPSVTTVSASLNPDEHVFDITDQTDVTLKGFEIRDARGTTQGVAGIFMNNASNCNISNNLVTNISATGWNSAYGIELRNSNDNTFSSSNISYIEADMALGILLFDSNNNTFSSTTSISYINATFYGCGIEIWNSNDNAFSSSITLSYINATDEVFGILVIGSNYNTFSSSITVSHINGRPGRIVVSGIGVGMSSHDNTFSSSISFSHITGTDVVNGIGLHSTNNNSFTSTISVSYITGTNTTGGIGLYQSNDNTFTSTICLSH